MITTGELLRRFVEFACFGAIAIVLGFALFPFFAFELAKFELLGDKLLKMLELAPLLFSVLLGVFIAALFWLRRANCVRLFKAESPKSGKKPVSPLDEFVSTASTDSIVLSTLS